MVQKPNFALFARIDRGTNRVVPITGILFEQLFQTHATSEYDLCVRKIIDRRRLCRFHDGWTFGESM